MIVSGEQVVERLMDPQPDQLGGIALRLPIEIAPCAAQSKRACWLRQSQSRKLGVRSASGCFVIFFTSHLHRSPR